MSRLVFCRVTSSVVCDTRIASCLKIYVLKILLIPLTDQPYNLCSKGPRGLKFVTDIGPPHAGSTTTFSFKIRQNFSFCKFECPSSAYVPMCADPRGLKSVFRIRHPHVGPTSTFVFVNSTKIFHFFNFFKKIMFLF